MPRHQRPHSVVLRGVAAIDGQADADRWGSSPRWATGSHPQLPVPDEVGPCGLCARCNPCGPARLLTGLTDRRQHYNWTTGQRPPCGWRARCNPWRGQTADSRLADRWQHHNWHRPQRGPCRASPLWSPSSTDCSGPRILSGNGGRWAIPAVSL